MLFFLIKNILIKTKNIFSKSNCFSEVGGRTLYRVLVGDTAGDNETNLLMDTVPSWVISNIQENSTAANKFIKIQFYLQPHSSVPSHLLKQDRNKKVS